MSEAEAGHKLDPAGIERQLEAHRGLEVPPRPVSRIRTPPSVPFRKAYAPQGNLAMLTAAAASSGYFSVASDPDGLVRWMPLVIQGGDDLFPPLSVLSYWHYLGKPRARGPRAGRGRRRRADRRSLRPHRRGRADADQLPRPAEDLSSLQHQRHPRRQAAGRHVQGQDRGGGATAIGIGDIRSTPFAPVYPGPEIHATVIDNMLTGDFIARPRWSRIFDLVGHRGPAAAGRRRAAAAVRLRRAAVRRDALRALRRRRLSALRARLRVAQHGVSGVRPRGDLHDADRSTAS